MSLFDVFMNYTSDRLKEFVSLCGGPRSLTRKADRANYLVATLTDPDQVRRLWDEMDDLSRKALAAAYHNDGIFNADAFVAQYGALPQRRRKQRWSWLSEPILLDLFIHDQEIPAELMPLLADVVPPPERFQLSGSKEPPAQILVHGEPIELFRAEREAAGLHDLTLYLTLLNQGKLKLSRSSLRLTPKSVKALAEKLHQGDWFEEWEKPDDAIIPFGLNVFCRESGLSSWQGSLTALGNQFLATQDTALLLDAFERWVEEGTFDELSRIKAIKGQRSKGIRLTKPATRREKIVEALSWCPTGEWISIFDFYRAIKIWHFDFEMEEGGLEKLYVGYHRPSYWYEPWASPEDQWLLINGLYINTILMEYLAVIGAIDIIYTYPEEGTFPAAPYSYDEIVISNYDGLLFFRINPLGAYLFGQADAYASSQPVAAALFTVSPTGEIILLKPDALTAAQEAQLEQITETEGGRRHLSRDKLLSILEDHPDLEIQRAFLHQHNQGPLPSEVVAWLDKIEEDSKALRIASKSLTIKVRSAELAQEVLADPKAGKIARRLDDKTLVIPASRETAFRNALREMGYGLKW